MAANFATFDEIIDDRLQAHIDRTGPDGQQKVEESVSLEADGAEVGTWLGHYLQTHHQDYRTRIFDNAYDFREYLAGLGLHIVKRLSSCWAVPSRLRARSDVVRRFGYG